MKHPKANPELKEEARLLKERLIAAGVKRVLTGYTAVGVWAKTDDRDPANEALFLKVIRETPDARITGTVEYKSDGKDQR